ncbi:hypothetical protein SFR_3464 [Streptomyces sp. FR-008]|nr:hypothetical protein SFR_3464 [Streptomyces sp. FR-008]
MAGRAALSEAGRRQPVGTGHLEGSSPPCLSPPNPSTSTPR